MSRSEPAADRAADLAREAPGGVPPCLELLRELVVLESPSAHPDRLARVAVRVERALSEQGAAVERIPSPGFGENLLGRIAGTEAGGPPLLVIGHMDTVHAEGTLERMPFEIDGERLRGPGVYDMKGGLAVALTALALLRRLGLRPARDLLFVVNCDEEIGSPGSRELIEANARAARGALVLEPCLPGGGAKTRRKGAVHWDVTVRGTAAHAGIDPERGASAIHELVRVLTSLESIPSPDEGTTVNVGLIEGGTGPNVIAEQARAVVDVRFWSAAEEARSRSAMAALRATDPRCTVTVTPGMSRGPLERTRASGALFERARAVAAAQGWTLEEGSTGGASDGNLTSAVGCATLDGLGPDGGGAHSSEEHLLLADLPRRIALVAGLFLEL